MLFFSGFALHLPGFTQPSRRLRWLTGRRSGWERSGADGGTGTMPTISYCWHLVAFRGRWGRRHFREAWIIDNNVPSLCVRCISSEYYPANLQPQQRLSLTWQPSDVSSWPCHLCLSEALPRQRLGTRRNTSPSTMELCPYPRMTPGWFCRWFSNIWRPGSWQRLWWLWMSIGDGQNVKTQSGSLLSNKRFIGFYFSFVS